MSKHFKCLLKVLALPLVLVVCILFTIVMVPVILGGVLFGLTGGSNEDGMSLANYLDGKGQEFVDWFRKL